MLPGDKYRKKNITAQMYWLPLFWYHPGLSHGLLFGGSLRRRNGS